MGWERRGLGQYFYRSRRVNGHVTKIYFGAGQRAQIAYERAQRHQEARKRERAIRKELEVLDVQTDIISDMIKTFVKASLLVAGFHQHKRTWRRKRHTYNMTQQQGDSMKPTSTLQETLSLETLTSLLQRATTGDESSLQGIRILLDQAPTTWQEAFGMTKRVETTWINTISKEDLLVKETLERHIATLKRTLETESTSPLEHLIIESICTTWLAYKHAELTSAEQLQRHRNGLTQEQQNHITACQKRYFSSIRELARIRQLLKPRTTTVINVADQQQVNVS
jgi:hypothetical protein